MKKIIYQLCLMVFVITTVGYVTTFAEENTSQASQTIETKKQKKYGHYQKPYKGKMKQAVSRLSQEKQDELKKIRSDARKKIQELKKKFKDAKGDQEKIAILKKEKSALKDERYKNIKSFFSGNQEVLKIIEEKRKMYEERKTKRHTLGDKRKKFKQKVKGKISKYRNSFIKRIGDNIEKIPSERLEKISTKIDTMISKYTRNEKIDEQKKEMVLSKLEALQEMIIEKLDSDDENAEQNDIDNLLTE